MVPGHTPMGSWAEPEEVAYGELFLASDESSVMTRLLLGLDGTVDRSPSLAWSSCVPLKTSRALMKATLVKRLFAATRNQ